MCKKILPLTIPICKLLECDYYTKQKLGLLNINCKYINKDTYLKETHLFYLLQYFIIYNQCKIKYFCIPKFKTLFHFFKQKPFLSDLIPDNHIDFHAHLLPGIDDGSSTMEETVNLIIGLQEIGIKKLITTPHVMGEIWKNSKTLILETENKVIDQLEKLTIKFPIKAAAEYMMDLEFLELFKNEKLLTLKENYVLVEMSYLSPPIQLFDIIFELQVAGYQPVLAHPERYNFYHHSLKNYKKLKQAGCLFQMNMLSATGYYGDRVAKAADILLKEQLIDFVGSDLHHTRHLEALHKKIILKNCNYLYPIFQNNSIFDF